MAVAVDASTPVRWAGTAVNPSGDTSAAFTAPANALLVCCVNYDTNNTGTGVTVTVSDSGGLTWTKQVERAGTEATAGGGSAVFTARTTSAASRTVTVAYNQVANTGTNRKSAKCYVLTGVDVDGTPVDTVGASNEGGSGTNNLTTTSLTPGATGLLVCADTDWNQLGLFTSSDLTIDTADYAGAVSVASGYKACTSGVGVTGNLNAGGTATAQHKWCQIIVRQASGGAQTATPGVATVAAGGVAPAATAGGAVTTTPGVGTAAVSGIAPAASGTGAATAAPGTGTVAVSGVAPGAAGAGVATATPGAATVAVSGTAPAAAPAGGVSLTPGVGTVSVSGVGPGAGGTGTATATPGAALVAVTAVDAAAAGAGLASPGVAGVGVAGVDAAALASGAVGVTPGAAAVAVGGLDAAVTPGVAVVVPGGAGVAVAGLDAADLASGVLLVSPGVAAVAVQAQSASASVSGGVPVPVVVLPAAYDPLVSLAAGYKPLVTLAAAHHPVVVFPAEAGVMDIPVSRENHWRGAKVTYRFALDPATVPGGISGWAGEARLYDRRDPSGVVLKTWPLVFDAVNLTADAAIPAGDTNGVTVAQGWLVAVLNTGEPLAGVHFALEGPPL